ncbi:MAG: type II secretion system protein [Verrucomicrobiota bacterium]
MKSREPCPGGKQASRGWTVIEILVTAAIIGLLAAVIIPSSQRIKAAAMSTQCLGKLRGLGVALNDYFTEKGPIYPDMVSARESKADDAPAMDTVLADYVRDEYAFQCPADHEGLFEKTGTSYFWNSLISGQRFGQVDLLGLTQDESGIPLMSDKENFHENIGDEVNVLYADGHVLKELQFSVGPR